MDTWRSAIGSSIPQFLDKLVDRPVSLPELNDDIYDIYGLRAARIVKEPQLVRVNIPSQLPA